MYRIFSGNGEIWRMVLAKTWLGRSIIGLLTNLHFIRNSCFLTYHVSSCFLLPWTLSCTFDLLSFPSNRSLGGVSLYQLFTPFKLSNNLQDKACYYMIHVAFVIIMSRRWVWWSLCCNNCKFQITWSNSHLHLCSGHRVYIHLMVMNLRGISSSSNFQ